MNTLNLQNMTTSQAGKDLIKQAEGWSPVPYHGKADRPGVITIGWGHVVRSHESFTSISQNPTGEFLLSQDLLFAEHDIKRLVKVELNQNQFDALVSFFFNLGDGPDHSTLISLVNQGKFLEAAEEFVKWDHVRDVHGNLVEAEGLKNRRLLEKDLFLKAVN